MPDNEPMGSGRASQEVGKTYIVDIDLPFVKVKETDTHRLEGECIRCGACCRKLTGSFQVGRERQTFIQDCKWLTFEETFVKSGEKKMIAKCKIYYQRPVGCATWPRPWNKLEETCGFRWVPKESPDDSQ